MKRPIRLFGEIGRIGKLILLPVGAAAPPDAAEERLLDDPEALVAFAPAEAFVHPAFAAHLFAAAAERPDAGLFYADEAELLPTGPELHLKPRSDELLQRSTGYMNLPLVVRGPVLKRLAGLDAGESLASLYALTLKAFDEGVGIEAVREVLIAHPGRRPLATLTDRRGALAAHLAARSAALTVLDGLTPASLRVRRCFTDAPAVTLITPTRQSRGSTGEPLVVRMLESLRRSTWPHGRLQVLVGDDVADAAAYGDLSRFPFSVRRLLTPRRPDEPFNYAAKMNRLWRAAAGDYLVFLNDDVEVVAPDWLEALMTFAVDADIGGVGARLDYPDGRVQHAGMAGGLFGAFTHPWIGRSGAEPTYGDWALSQREWSAVSGAVFATRRSVLEAVNGFDEHFSLEYNDVDLCLRMRMLGYRIAYAPGARFIHHEKQSRGGAAPQPSQTAAFLNRWEQVIADDPAYHPGLTDEDFRVEPKAVSGAWFQRIDADGSAGLL